MCEDDVSLPVHQVEVDGVALAVHEVPADDAAAPTIVLLHGNPTSNHLWRGVLPHLRGLGRLVAPDLVGMGRSGRTGRTGRDAYRFVEHRHYLDGLLRALDVGDRVVLVVHDWGSGLGFDWANRHRDRVAGIAYMEAICGPLSASEWPEEARRIFEGMRSDAGEDLVLERNVFVERILPASILRELTAEELAVYRRPYEQPGESRRPTLTWPRELPWDGEPADVAAIVAEYAAWLADSHGLPKLYVRAEPGFLTGVYDERCRRWPDQDEVTVAGIHFVQEDSPDEIGRAIAEWIRRRIA